MDNKTKKQSSSKILNDKDANNWTKLYISPIWVKISCVWPKVQRLLWACSDFPMIFKELMENQNVDDRNDTLAAPEENDNQRQPDKPRILLPTVIHI